MTPNNKTEITQKTSQRISNNNKRTPATIHYHQKEFEAVQNGNMIKLLLLALIVLSSNIWLAYTFVANPSRIIGVNRFVLSHCSENRKSGSALFGIRGFRAWFESQFPDAMIAFEHKAINAPPKKKGDSTKMKTKGNSSPSSETFHHVLIDVNQLLHITLRRSKSDDHALVLLLKELDKCLSIAKPTKSITLAFDGPPSAAKLATQRRRRYGIIMRNVKKKERMKLLIEKGLILPPEKTKKSSSKYKRSSRKEEREELTLAITPGTEFMKRSEDAVLYWAWQRLSNPNSKMQLQNCRIYISPSSVPGEGEVKLLDWLFQAGQFSQHTSTVRNNVPIIKKGESVAIMGGDSDLVLEGLIIPPSITHNVFVILPSGSNKSYAVSLWETTLTLGKFLGDRFNPNDTMRIRTDLVLLLIMNGNDYLPKLRGSSGFNKLFHTYLYLLKKWLSKNDRTGARQKPYFMDPNTLEWNLPFTISFFETLSNTAPKSLSQPTDAVSYQKSVTPLSQLYSLVDSGLFPSPASFKILKNNDDSGNDVMRLTLGKESAMENTETKDEDVKVLKTYYEFDVDHKEGQPLKKAKQSLAKVALGTLFGQDVVEFNDFDEDPTAIDDDMSDEDDEDSLGGDFSLLSNGIGYSWEMDTAAPCSVEEYIKGLVWNLATYQDGVCSDYSFNYGRRMSPTADEMMSYFKDAERNGKRLGRHDILSTNFTDALSDGLSCLAALPTEVSHLIPEPYRSLSESGVVESIYAACMDKNTNVFDIELFKKKCFKHLDKESLVKHNKGSNRFATKRGRQIRTGKTFWTVLRRVPKPLVHPYQPPKGFSERLSPLRYDSKIKAFHMHSTDRPRWLRTQQQSGHDRSKFTDMKEILPHNYNLEDVPYIKAYQSNVNKKVRSSKKGKTLQQTKRLSTTAFAARREIVDNNDTHFDEIAFNDTSRMLKYGIQPPPDTVMTNREGMNPVQCIQELSNAGAILTILWNQTTPSCTAYAATNPNSYELVKLEITGHRFEHSFSQDRNTKTCSRQTMKHHLASFALEKIFLDSDWTEMTIHEMKASLSSTRSKAKK